jgi:hypothetical protein
MVNQIGPRHFLIDTPGATPLWLTWLKVISITWTGATTAGHQAIVTNASGTRVIFDAKASEANDFESAVYDPGWVEGLVVTTLQSGKLMIVCS